MTAALRYFSGCSGIEAATVAWEPLGWRAVGYAEVDPFACRVLHHHYSAGRPRVMPDPDAPGLKHKERQARRAAIKAINCLPERANGVPNHGDLTALDLGAVPPLDIFVAGTPYQAFSIAGKRLSLADARGNLSLIYTVLAHEFARSHGLRWAVWENVPGVLCLDDNAFGCFLGGLVGADHPVPLPRGAERWPDAGMVAGPRARAAWRVLDAQYFGLAQRRRRLFVVAGFGPRADPAAVLFEQHGLRRDPPTRRKSGEGPAGTLTGSLARRGGNPGEGDTEGYLVAGTLGTRSADHPSGVKSEADFLVPVAFGGNRTSGPIDVATAVRAHGGPCGHIDFESETFVVASALKARDSARGVDSDCTDTFMPIAFTGKDYGGDAGDLSPTLRSMGHDGSHANGGGQVAVAFDLRGREGGAQFEGPHQTANIRAASGGSSRSYIATSWAVRRLMPVETERLQGFADGYTAIPGAADGPRYKTHGNSMAVPCMAWIGRRIAAVEQATSEHPAMQEAAE